MREGLNQHEGAIYWRNNPRNSLHVCSTGPTLVLGLRLIPYLGSEFLPSLVRMQDWLWGMRDETGLFRDHKEVATGTIDSSLFTYNTGTPLEALLLWISSGSDKSSLLLKQATETLNALPQFIQEGRFPTTPWFNVVLLRALIRAQHQLDVSKFITPFIIEMEASWLLAMETGECLTLPNNSNGEELLLRDRAAAVETLALLHHWQRYGN